VLHDNESGDAFLQGGISQIHIVKSLKESVQIVLNWEKKLIENGVKMRISMQDTHPMLMEKILVGKNP